MIDSTQWSEIYKKHSKKMFWVCKRYVNDASLAEDLMHEGFITAMQKQDTFSGFGSFEGWLRTIMVNTSLLYLRDNKNRFFVSDIDIPNTTTAPTDMASNTDIKSKILNTDFTQQELLDVVEEIPEHHKIVFNMFVMDKFSHNEISKTLNITTNTSKSHLLRARKKIQELLFLKANEKEEKKDRKKLFFWFLFSGSYIDSIYAKSFSSFQESPSKPFNIEEVIKQQNLPNKITSGHIFGITLQKLVIATALAALIVAAFFLLDNENSTEVKSDPVINEVSNATMPNGETNSTSMQKDSLQIHKPNQQSGEKDALLHDANKKTSNAGLDRKDASKTGFQETSDQVKKRPPQKNRNKNPVVIKKIIDTVYVYK